MKNKLLLIWLLLLTCLAVHSQRWAEKGDDLSGVDANDYFGSSISLSSDGNTLAIGATEIYNGSTGKGYVKVYKWNSSQWTQKGQKLNGTADTDDFGHSTDLSSDGNTLIVGARQADPNGSNSGQVKVFKWNGSSWSLKGNSIDGDSANFYFGASVSISSLGHVIAVGSAGIDIWEDAANTTAKVKIYSWDGSSWVQKGGSLNGHVSTDNAGFSIDLSDDGNTIVIGVPNHDSPETGDMYDGQVLIYEWDGTNWQQKGANLDGKRAGALGSAVSLSADGNTVAASEPSNNMRINDKFMQGFVNVYTWDGAAWEKKGNDIEGDVDLALLGYSISLSADGNTIIISSEKSYAETKIFTWQDSVWVKKGNIIKSDDNQDHVKSVAMDNSGNKIAIGIPDDSPSGKVKTFTFCYDTYDTITTNACYSYTSLGGKTWDASGVYTDTILNKAGCDSIITINLTIHEDTDTTFAVEACHSYTSPSGKIFTTDSVLTDTILNSIGCDSIMTIDLTIFETAYDTTTLTKCVSYRSPSGKYMWTESGTYTDTMETAKGCDSILTIHLTINKVDTSVTVSENTLTANAQFSAFQWLDCNNNYSIIEDATLQVFTPSQAGHYAVEVTSKENCKDTSRCFGTGIYYKIENDFGNDFNVYPNPTSGNISIELGKTYHDVILSLKTMDSKKINTMEAGTCNRVEYTIQSPPGTYLLEIKAGENKKATVKIIKH